MNLKQHETRKVCLLLRITLLHFIKYLCLKPPYRKKYSHRGISSEPILCSTLHVNFLLKFTNRGVELLSWLIVQVVCRISRKQHICEARTRKYQQTRWGRTKLLKSGCKKKTLFAAFLWIRVGMQPVRYESVAAQHARLLQRNKWLVLKESKHLYLFTWNLLLHKHNQRRKWIVFKKFKQISS